jgi:hypothetical protein
MIAYIAVNEQIILLILYYTLSQSEVNVKPAIEESDGWYVLEGGILVVIDISYNVPYSNLNQMHFICHTMNGNNVIDDNTSTLKSINSMKNRAKIWSCTIFSASCIHKSYSR